MAVIHRKDVNARVWFFLLNLFFFQTTFAAAPFLTNDPETLPYKNWKLYLFSNLDSSPTATTISLPAVQLKYGAITDLELQAMIPAVDYLPKTGHHAYGLGDSAIVFKYRFIHETDYFPQVAFHPIFEIPTGNEKRHLGNGRLWMKLPIVFQKSFGHWTTYGGGGYVLNSAPNNRNYPYGGWVVERDLNDVFMLGGEIYSQGRSSTTTPSYTLINIGSTYQLTKSMNVLFSMGHNILGQRNTIAYFGFAWIGCLS